MMRGPPTATLFACTTHFRSVYEQAAQSAEPSHLAKYAFQLARAFNNFYHHDDNRILEQRSPVRRAVLIIVTDFVRTRLTAADRKSTRLTSSHANISYAVFCL